MLPQVETIFKLLQKLVNIHDIPAAMVDTNCQARMIFTNEPLCPSECSQLTALNIHFDHTDIRKGFMLIQCNNRYHILTMFIKR